MTYFSNLVSKSFVSDASNVPRSTSKSKCFSTVIGLYFSAFFCSLSKIWFTISIIYEYLVHILRKLPQNKQITSKIFNIYRASCLHVPYAITIIVRAYAISPSPFPTFDTDDPTCRTIRQNHNEWKNHHQNQISGIVIMNFISVQVGYVYV